MTLELYTELKNEINERVDKYSDILNSFPKNASGMVEVTPEFRTAKNNFDIAFDQLRVLNSSVSNKLKREYRMLNRKR